jgi:hypothetical protein
MNAKYTSKQQIDAIHNLMERSSRFISLSGLSGIAAGIVALIGALFAYFYLEFDTRYFNIGRYFNDKLYRLFPEKLAILLLDAAIMLVCALSFAIFFTTRKAKQKGLNVWSHATRLMLYNLSIPLLAGGIFCLILLSYHLIFLVAPVTLIFYGLALLNASKYTLPEIQWLGISEILLGLIASIWVGYGLIFWTIGFGLLHILYGTIMYFRYESKRA